jgi:hypothetical protein
MVIESTTSKHANSEDDNMIYPLPDARVMILHEKTSGVIFLFV